MFKCIYLLPHRLGTYLNIITATHMFIITILLLLLLLFYKNYSEMHQMAQIPLYLSCIWMTHCMYM